MGVKVTDVFYFVAEVLVYVAIVWWSFTRDVFLPVRWLLAIALFAGFAAAWGIFAAPRAIVPLTGAADITFRFVWFALGATAAVAVVLGITNT